MLLTLSLPACARRCFVVVVREKTGLQDTGLEGTVPETSYYWSIKLVFLNRRAAALYRALASIIPGRERFSWNLSF